MKELDYSSIEIEDIDTKDYPDFTDAFISHAKWNNGVELTNEELDELNEEGISNELIHENQLYL
jgi:hypothetical protein